MLKNLLKISISLILMGYLLWISDLTLVWQQSKNIHWLYIFACMAMLCIAQALSAMRWQWILNSEGAEISLKTLFASYMAGMFFNNFFPTTIGGDAVKSYDIYRLTKNPSLSITSVFLERFSGLVVLIFSVPLIILISLLPISFGGLGIREGLTVFMFSFAGVPNDMAVENTSNTR